MGLEGLDRVEHRTHTYISAIFNLRICFITYDSLLCLSLDGHLVQTSPWCSPRNALHSLFRKYLLNECSLIDIQAYTFLLHPLAMKYQGRNSAEYFTWVISFNLHSPMRQVLLEVQALTLSHISINWRFKIRSLELGVTPRATKVYLTR